MLEKILYKERGEECFRVVSVTEGVLRTFSTDRRTEQCDISFFFFGKMQRRFIAKIVRSLGNISEGGVLRRIVLHEFSRNSWLYAKKWLSRFHWRLFPRKFDKCMEYHEFFPILWVTFGTFPQCMEEKW